jgi:PAS domain S-box-containing protein
VAELPDRPSDANLARRLEGLGDTSGLAVALGDAAGCIEWVNAAFQRLTGHAVAELTGKRLDLLQGLDIGEPALDYVLTRFRSGESSRLRIPTRRERGRSERWLDIEVRPLGPDDGFAVLVSDVTERKLAPPGPKVRARPAGHLEDRDPRAPSTSPGPSPVPRLTLRLVDVSGLVIQNYDLLEAAVSGRTLLDLDLAGNLPSVKADVVRLREVLVSLVRQAADALAGAPGTIRVRTSVSQGEAFPGGVELEVRDTGWGAERARFASAMGASSPHAAHRVLGLAEIRGIVQGHGGTLAITSRSCEGTRAVVTFPCRVDG